LINLNQVASELVEKRFQLESLSIRATRLATEPPDVYTGPGTIAQNASGHFTLRLYCADPSFSWRSFLKPALTPGRMIPDDRFFSLRLTDLAGNEWAADRVFMDFRTGRDTEPSRRHCWRRHDDHPAVAGRGARNPGALDRRSGYDPGECPP